MPEMKLLVIAGRSLKQGTGLNMGKDSLEYVEAVSTLEMNGGDMNLLGLQNGDQAQISTLTGQAKVRCRRAELPAGLAFIAYGPASSVLMGTETHASGMPDSKHLEVMIQTDTGGEAYAS